MFLGTYRLRGIQADPTDEGYRFYWSSSLEKQHLIGPSCQEQTPPL